MDVRVTSNPPPVQPVQNPCIRCDRRRQSVCGVLQDHELEAFSAIVHNRRLGAGETIVAEGDPVHYFYNLVSGAVRLVKLLPNGRRQIIGFLYPGAFLGLATQGTYPYAAETLSDVVLCQFETKGFHAFLDRSPELRSELLDRANTELTIAQDQMLLLGRKTPTERLASFLLRLADNPDGAPGAVIDLVMTRQDIADYLGLTIETVSRTFSRFKAGGLIALPNRSRVIIKDFARLSDIAEDD